MAGIGKRDKMVLIIILDLISVFLSLVVFNLAHNLRPSFEKLVRPLLVIFYSVGVLVISLSILEITGFIAIDESVSGVGIHLVILGIVVLIVLGLNKLRVAQLRNDLQEVRLLNRMRVEFLARTSHELKTPLTPLIMQLQMLKKEKFGKVNKQQLESIEMLERNIKRLSSLINDILFFTRSSAGKIKLNKEPTSLNTLIQNALKTMRNKANKKKVSLTFTQGKIPKVECDPNRITEVMVNLIDNAIKFVEKEGIIWLETKKLKESVLVSVHDNGIGISKENMPKLFTPFTQLATVATRKQGGTGVGLSISKSLVELHKGEIWAESEGKGKGTTIHFILPLNKRPKPLSEKEKNGIGNHGNKEQNYKSHAQ